MYESLKEHFDVLIALFIAALSAIVGLLAARGKKVEKTIDEHDARIKAIEIDGSPLAQSLDERLEQQHRTLDEMQRTAGVGVQSVLAEIRVVRSEVSAAMSEMRAFVAENYRRRGDNGELQ